MDKYKEKEDLTDLDKKILKRAKSQAPLIDFTIMVPKDGAKEGDVFIRGSFTHNSGEELAAITQIASESTFMYVLDLAEDAGQGYEADRKRKQAMTFEEINKKD